MSWKSLRRLYLDTVNPTIKEMLDVSNTMALVISVMQEKNSEAPKPKNWEEVRSLVTESLHRNISEENLSLYDALHDVLQELVTAAESQGAFVDE